MTALNFPSNPSDGDTYENYVYDATVGVWRILVPARGQLGGLDDINFSSLTAGDKLVFDGTNWVNLTGYVLVDTVYFTSNGTFTKATYPWLRAIRVKVQAGGGGSGTCRATGVDQGSGSGGGGGGAYAESFITDIAGLTSSVTVTRGAGGAGGSGTDVAGSNGGASSFGAGQAFEVSAPGGVGSAFSFARTVPTAPAAGGARSGLGVGQFSVEGSGGGAPFVFSGEGIHGPGGVSFLAGTQSAARSVSGANGLAGNQYGGGARGCINIPSQATARNGVSGAAGIVIVELYA